MPQSWVLGCSSTLLSSVTSTVYAVVPLPGLLDSSTEYDICSDCCAAVRLECAHREAVQVFFCHFGGLVTMRSFGVAHAV
jgi:hypothetical protein